MTYRLGLTGSIGMGKSTTAAMFREEGLPVWDADTAVHRLYAPGGAAVVPVGAAFPESVVDGAISRHLLKAALVSDPAALRRLEAIVHPLVARDREAFAAAAVADIVVFDVPLLYETGDADWYDSVAVVTAPPEVQAARVLARPGMTEHQFRTLLSRQLPDSEKRATADHIIETRTLDATRAAVRKLIATIRAGSGERHA